MKKHNNIVFLTILFSFLNAQSQTFKLSEFYNGEGVIINDYKSPFPFRYDSNLYSKKCTINKTDLIEVEIAIQKNYFEYKSKLLNHFKKKNNIRELKNPENVKKKFLNYNRQYSAFINQRNDTIIYVYMMNFSDSIEAEKIYPNWRNELIILFHNTGNEEDFLYNKSKRKLEDLF